MQREIAEHDETRCEAGPPNRDLVVEDAEIDHLSVAPNGS
jgi:hypothetical protein